MKVRVCIPAVCLCVLLFPARSRADVVNLKVASVATGVDNGPQDGIFDSFTALNLGSVNNNGYTSFRTAYEFDLTGVPTSINSAKLTVVLSNYEGARSLAVHGYTGTGVVQLGDFSVNHLLASTTVASGSGQRLVLDVTDFVTDLLANHDSFAGFSLREDPANTLNYLVMFLGGQEYYWTVPTLSIDFTTIPSNQPPTADAGADQAVRPGTTVSLNGAGSFDDNTPTEQLGFLWTLVSKPAASAAVLDGAGTATPTFVADVWGNYVVQLVVTDQAGLQSGADEVSIGIDLPPSADAGLDKVVVTGSVVTLSGSGLDPDRDGLAFAWSLQTTPPTSAALLNQANSATPAFVADLPGVYEAQLVVSDFLGGGAPDSVRITAITPANYMEMEIQLAASIVSDLPPTNWTSKGIRQAFLNYLSQAIALIETDDLENARQKVESAMVRLDGCALRGTPDGNGASRDWITACDAQGQVRTPLAAALSIMAR